MKKFNIRIEDDLVRSDSGTVLLYPATAVGMAP